MELTARYLRERFKLLNDKFFDSQLPEPKLIVSKARTQMGLFSYRRQPKGFLGRFQNVDFKIRISEYFKQTVEEIDDTLLHEMIHFLIAFRHLRDSSAHGPLFRAEMDRLNKLGRHITISVPTAHLSTRHQPSRKQHLVLALQGVGKRRYLAVVNPSYKKYIEGLLPLASTILSYKWFVSTNEYFNDFPQARSLRARRVSVEEYDNVVNSEK